jgi:hypothetical protein
MLDFLKLVNLGLHYFHGSSMPNPLGSLFFQKFIRGFTNAASSAAMVPTNIKKTGPGVKETMFLLVFNPLPSG